MESVVNPHIKKLRDDPINNIGSFLKYACKIVTNCIKLKPINIVLDKLSEFLFLWILISCGMNKTAFINRPMPNKNSINKIVIRQTYSFS